jgi:hypothetical protein
MKNAFALISILVVAACSSSSKSAPAPVISEFTMPAQVAAGTTMVTGSVVVSDTGGLGDFTMSMTISGTGFSQTLMIPGPSAATETTATVEPEIVLSASTPAGTYKVTITVSEDGATSNALSATVVLE